MIWLQKRFCGVTGEGWLVIVGTDVVLGVFAYCLVKALS